MVALELAREYEDKSGESAAINGLGTNALTMGSWRVRSIIFKKASRSLELQTTLNQSGIPQQHR